MRRFSVSTILFCVALALIIYMPLHVLVVQSASLATGGIQIWKAAKDVLVFLLVPALIFIGYKRHLFDGKYKWHFAIGALYVFIHLLYVVFDGNDDTYSAVVATVYNSRLLVYFFLGLVLGSYKLGERYLKWLLTAAVLIASAVALFGVLQYILPHDILTHAGYTLERGVKPMFFIDDKPDLPRIMSTLKDPNSLGAYLILPILLTGFALFKRQVNEKLFAKPFRRGTLAVMLVLQFVALFLTFSRGALIGLAISVVTLLSVVTGQRMLAIFKKYWYVLALGTLVLGGIFFFSRNSYLVQNVIFHADQSTVLADPNELRVSLTQDAIEDIVETPAGHGPGTAGLIAIKNPKGGILTENYYLQIAYEVGWLGVILFVAILFIIMYQLFGFSKNNPAAAILFSAGVGYLFISHLIHLWSNEAVALQWWLLTGTTLGVLYSKSAEKKT